MIAKKTTGTRAQQNGPETRSWIKKPGGSTNKYHARRVEVEGQLFDSVKEAKRWIYLRSLEKAGKISDLHRQVKYVLIPTQRDDNRRVVERECAYIADFVYREGDRLIVEDVKGYKGGPAFAMFSIKRKLLLFRFGIKINVI